MPLTETRQTRRRRSSPVAAQQDTARRVGWSTYERQDDSVLWQLETAAIGRPPPRHALADSSIRTGAVAVSDRPEARVRPLRDACELRPLRGSSKCLPERRRRRRRVGLTTYLDDRARAATLSSRPAGRAAKGYCSGRAVDRTVTLRIPCSAPAVWVVSRRSRTRQETACRLGPPQRRSPRQYGAATATATPSLTCTTGWGLAVDARCPQQT